VEFKRLWQVVNGGTVDSGDHESSGTNELQLEGLFDIALNLHSTEISGNEGANQTDKDTNSRDDDREDHGIPSTRNSNAASDDKSGACGFGETSEKIRSHSSNISNIVADLSMDVNAPRRKLTEVKIPRAMSHPVPQLTRKRIKTGNAIQNQKGEFEIANQWESNCLPEFAQGTHGQGREIL
jgi:hypothetical protein